MQNNDNITTISLLRLLSEGKLDKGRGQFYDKECYVLINPRLHEIKEGRSMFRDPTRLDCFIFLLCKEGNFTFTCNLQEVSIGPGTVFFTQPDSIIQVRETRECSTAIIMFSEKFMRQINISTQNLLPHIGPLNQLCTLRPNPQAFTHLWHQLDMVNENISQPATLSYYREIVENGIRSFGYTFFSLLIQHMESRNEGHGNAVRNHEEELFRRFIQLVGRHYRAERRIAFYAGRMNLTSKYLSAVIRRASGHGPAEWIAHNVLIEAKNQLRYSDRSIQEVAYSLHFPNQSFFGRWFKAQTGLSPKSYRQSR